MIWVLSDNEILRPEKDIVNKDDANKPSTRLQTKGCKRGSENNAWNYSLEIAN